MAEAVKLVFANQLKEALLRVYKGRLPSIASIARDFSLKSPHLSHISSETIRKWLRGESLPHVSRMQVLIDWLGPEIASPFEKFGHAVSHHNNQHFTDTSLSLDNNARELLRYAQILTEREYQSVLSIARLLAEKHEFDQPPEAVIGNGHLRNQIDD